jgi:hypothetical protein
MEKLRKELQELKLKIPYTEYIQIIDDQECKLGIWFMGDTFMTCEIVGNTGKFNTNSIRYYKIEFIDVLQKLRKV